MGRQGERGAIGFPIRHGNHAIGAINLVLQRSLVTEPDIKKRYVPLLRVLANEIPADAAQPR